MKQESTKKSKKSLLVIGIAAVLVAVGVLLAVFLPGLLGGDQSESGASSKVYWNVDRVDNVDPETGLSARVPGEDGLYHILFSVDGEQVELTCADKKLVNKLDLNQVMGLVFDDNGQIIDMIKIDELVGKVIKNVFVQKVTAKGFTTNSSIALNGMEVKYKITDNTKIYDVTPETEKVGAPGEMAVMDKVIVLLDAEENVTHVFVVEAAWESPVYWRTSPRMWNSTTKHSARQPDADGYWTIEFFVDGEYVTLRTKKQDCVDAIDSYTGNLSMGLLLDENGLIYDVFSASRAAKGMVVSNNYTVMSVDGDSFEVEALTGSDQGKTYSGMVTEETKIYDMTNTVTKPGAETEIRVSDTVYAIANADGDLIYVFITKRITDAPVYVNLNRKYNTNTGRTTQTPNEDGWYEIEMVAGTKKLTVRTKDEGIATEIHAPVGRMVGLRLNGDVVEAVYDPSNVTGGKEFALWQYVTAINEPVITSELAKGTSASTGVLAEDCKVYLIGYSGTVPYKETKLQLHDRMLTMTNAKGEICLIYVFQRKLDLPVYWNTAGRKWNAAKKETARVPNEEGYYVYTMTTGGKRPTELKTKDKKIANWLDSRALTCYALKVDSNGIIKEAHDAAAAAGGGSIASWYTITGINGKRVETQNAAGTTKAFTLTDDYKCYNVSGGLGCWEYMGEKTTPKVGDKVHGFNIREGREEVPLLYVVNRPEPQDFVVGWKVDRKYSTTKAETTRVPDENGYYVFQMAVKGEIKTYKTKEKAVATALDKEITAMALNVKNGIVYRAIALYNTQKYGSSGKGSYYTVMKISGNKVYLQNAAGKEAELTMASKYECYDVSSYAEKFGAKTTFKVGDKIHSYHDNEDKNVILTYVVNAYVRKTEFTKPCPHCGETVIWSAFTGGVGNGHYYLPKDRNAGQISIGADAEGNPYDFVLDMNGYDWNCTGKALLVWKNAKAYIFDSTGYDYTVKAVGPKDSYHSGVIQMIDGELTLVGGNYVFDDSNKTIAQGGVMTTWSAKSVINATGVDFVGGNMVEHQPAEGTAKKANQGSTLSLAGGTANFNDCTFTGGSIPSGNGGNIYIGGGTNANFNGCAIIGGTAGSDGGTGRGGAVALISNSKGKVTFTDTEITGGKASDIGGLFVYSSVAELGEGTYIHGNTLRNGTLNNLYISGANSAVTMNGAKIDGAAQFTNGTLTVSGNTVLDKGTTEATYGLKIAAGKQMTVGQLGEKAKLGISATGVFTTEGDIETLRGYVADGKLYSEDPDAPITEKGKALMMGIIRCINGHTDHEGIECAEPIVSWRYWNEKAAAEFGYTGGEKGDYTTKMTGVGNFILMDDLTLSAQRTTGNGTLRIDLNGHDIIRYVDAGATTSNARAFYTWDPNTEDSVIPQLQLTDLATEGEAGSVKLSFAEGVSTTATGALIYGGSNGNGGAIKIAGRVVLDGTGLSKVAVATERGDLTLYGGTIKGNVSVYSAATGAVTIGGNAAVEGAVTLSNFSTATISGAPVLKELVIASGKTVTLGQLDAQAKITVNASGTFTTEGDEATLQAYLDNEQIVAADSDMILSVKENALHGAMPEIKYCLKGHKDHEGVDCALEILTWTKWKKTDSLPTEGNYILTDHVITKDTTKATGELNLDLNGKNITRQITEEGYTMVLQAVGGTVVAITDTTAEPGTISLNLADSVKDVAFAQAGGKNFYTGAVLENSATGAGLILYNGIIDASNLKTNHSGGAAITVNGTFMMFGGTVKGTQAVKDGSAISGFGSSTIEIYGGELYGDVAGNGVYTGGKFSLLGGKIVNSLKIGTGTSTGVVTIGGDAVVEDGVILKGYTSVTVSGTPKLENVTVPAGKTVDFTGVTGGEITVTAEGVFSTAFDDDTAATAAMAYIKPAQADCTMSVSSNALSMTKTVTPPPADSTVVATRCINGHTDHEGIECTEEIVQWKYWNNDNAKASISSWGTYTDGEYKTRLDGTGNWILQEDVNLSGTRSNGNGTLRIDLNGHNIIRTATTASPYTRAFSVSNSKGHIAVTDLSTEGEAGAVKAVVSDGVTCNYNSGNGYGALVYIGVNSFKLAGRAVLDASNLTTTYSTGGATIQINNAGESFVMYGGIVKGMAETATAASAVHGWGGSTIEIYGGEIVSVPTEIAVYAPTTFTMTGGKITGDLKISTGASAGNRGVTTIGGTAQITGTVQLMGCTEAKISGTPVIHNISNTSGVKLDLTGVTGGKIGITAADGVFTTNFKNKWEAEKATAFVNATDSAKAVVISGAALTIKNASDMIHCIQGHANHTAVECDQPIVEWKYWNNDNAKASIGSWGTYTDGEYKTRMEGTGNWILTEDVKLTSQRTTGSGTLRIDLNGHNITNRVTASVTSDKARVFYIYDPNASDAIIPGLAITDLSTEGTAGSVKLVYDSGVTTKPATGSLVYASHGPFALAGRAFLDSTNMNGFTPVSVNVAKSFTMYGGQINNPYGYAVYLDNTAATVDVRGNSVVQGTFKVNKSASVAVSGNVKLDKVSLTQGQLLTVGELGSEANIGVAIYNGSAYVPGAITTEFATEAAAAAAAPRFSCFKTGNVVATGKVLAIQ